MSTTWFDTIQKSFTDVPVNAADKGISTTEFLQAAESLTSLFGKELIRVVLEDEQCS